MKGASVAKCTTISSNGVQMGVQMGDVFNINHISVRSEFLFL